MILRGAVKESTTHHRRQRSKIMSSFHLEEDIQLFNLLFKVRGLQFFSDTEKNNNNNDLTFHNGDPIIWKSVQRSLVQVKMVIRLLVNGDPTSSKLSVTASF